MPIGASIPNTMAQQFITADLGEGLPPNDIHAVSVSLPKWQDTVGWANRDPQVLAHLKTGYPRFFIHRLVDKLATLLLRWAIQTETVMDVVGDVESNATLSAMLFPDSGMGQLCRDYLQRVEKDRSNKYAIVAFQVNFCGHLEIVQSSILEMRSEPFQSLCVVVFPDHLFKEAKAFWQHTGFGASSRHALYWLDHAPFLQGPVEGRSQASKLPLAAAKDAVHTIKGRISGLLSSKSNLVQQGDVFLYPSGMSAIAHSASALQAIHKDSSNSFRVAVFGFLYVDTFKVLSKIKQIDCILYGHASPSDTDRLEHDLQNGLQIHALYTEFPGNPLLGSLDLARIYELSRKFNFHVVVDDTIGTSVNLDLTLFCDIICTSLTKIFSGACNVMGGSVTICPQSKCKTALQATLASQFIDTYFPLDVLVMEQNSRDFVQRMCVANQNALAVATKLRQHPVVDRVFYPSGSATQHLYERYQRKPHRAGEEETSPGAGYGYLLSIRFVKDSAAIAFHDALEVAKGPNLGTNFTLCCAYTLLAHASELAWAAEYGVVEHLVRLSVGIENIEALEERVDRALEQAAKMVSE